MTNHQEKMLDLLEEILTEKTAGVSEYQLIKLMKDKGYDILEGKSLFDNLVLFQTHFIIFHYLYLLQDRYRQENKGDIEIHCLKINLQKNISPGDNNLEVTDSLRDYYMDMSNLSSTDKEDVDQMLVQFWNKFEHYNKKSDAFLTLELDENATTDQIKKRYRELALQHHPDKGGCPIRFNEISEAASCLLAFA